MPRRSWTKRANTSRHSECTMLWSIRCRDSAVKLCPRTSPVIWVTVRTLRKIECCCGKPRAKKSMKNNNIIILISYHGPALKTCLGFWEGKQINAFGACLQQCARPPSWRRPRGMRRWPCGPVETLTSNARHEKPRSLSLFDLLPCLVFSWTPKAVPKMNVIIRVVCADGRDKVSNLNHLSFIQSNHYWFNVTQWMITTIWSNMSRIKAPLPSNQPTELVRWSWFLRAPLIPWRPMASRRTATCGWSKPKRLCLGEVVKQRGCWYVIVIVLILTCSFHAGMILTTEGLRVCIIFLLQRRHHLNYNCFSKVMFLLYVFIPFFYLLRPAETSA